MNLPDEIPKKSDLLNPFSQWNKLFMWAKTYHKIYYSKIFDNDDNAFASKIVDFIKGLSKNKQRRILRKQSIERKKEII